MAEVQHTFVNQKDSPIYVSVEPWPECFELDVGEKLTLIWDAPPSGNAAQTDFINDRELVVWPSGEIGKMRFLVDDQEAESRSWVFKHR